MNTGLPLPIRLRDLTHIAARHLFLELKHMTASTGKVWSKKEAAVAWVIFDNVARHNAMSLAMWEELSAILHDLSQDKMIRVLILRGAGRKAFVSGADISEFEEKRATLAAIHAYNAAARAAQNSIMAIQKPVIAMINGFCIGGGLGIALCCDLRIASEASCFGIPAAKLGVGYRGESIKRMAEIIGPTHAANIFFTGRQFTAQEALQMGLINYSLPAVSLENFVADYAADIAANAPLTIAAVKQTLIEIYKDPSDRDIALCNAMEDACSTSDDYKEGRAAFKEKRRPMFKGS